MQQISPELALVDPELAAAARARLRDPPDCLAPRPPVAPAAALADTVADAGGAPVRVRSRSRRIVTIVGTVAAWVVIAALLASPFLAFLPPDASMQPQILEQGEGPAIDAEAPAVADDLVIPPVPTPLEPIDDNGVRLSPPTVVGDPAESSTRASGSPGGAGLP